MFACSSGSVPKDSLKIWYTSILEMKIIYGVSVCISRLPPAYGLGI